MAMYFIVRLNKSFVSLIITLVQLSIQGAPVSYYNKKGPLIKVVNFENENGQKSVIIKAANCNILKKQVRDLNFLRKKLGEKAISNNEECICQKDSLMEKLGSYLNNEPVDYKEEMYRCSLDISSSIPIIMKKLIASDQKIKGPNCFNTSLLTNKFVKNKRYSPPYEIDFWMNSPLCKLRKENEKLSTGDIIVTWEKPIGFIDERLEVNNMSHSFVYINEHISFGKDGLDSSAKYRIRNTIGDFRFFHFGSPTIISHNCENIGRSNDDNCRRYGRAYDCKPPNDTIFSYLNSEQDYVFNRLLNIGNVIESSVFMTSQLNKPIERDEIQTELKELKKIAKENGGLVFFGKNTDVYSDPEDLGKTVDPSRANGIFWDSILHKIRGFEQQLELIRLNKVFSSRNK